MNIVLSTDDNYAQHCAVTITSICQHNRDVKLYIVTDGLCEENQKILQSVVFGGGEIHFLYVDKEKIRKDFPMPVNTEISHISLATYYRLFLAELVPVDVEKILYLDCDMIVRDSLDELWNKDVEGKALAACYLNNAFGRVKNVYQKLGYSEEYKYFNAGMLLINLRYWREHDVQRRFLEYVEKNYENIVYQDQDILNAVCHKEVLHVEPSFNMDLAYISEDEAENYDVPFEELKRYFFNPVIVHFVSRPKPWEYGCSHPYCEEYFKYLDMTPYKGWRPSFNWKNYCNFVLRQKVRSIRNRMKL